MGIPYTDTAWFGFWGVNTVFGMYPSYKIRDGSPQRYYTSNGYASLWTQDATDTYDYLVSQGSTFPTIPAITENSGLDQQPGYLQVVATDSEGSILLFTEYTGN